MIIGLITLLSLSCIGRTKFRWWIFSFKTYECEVAEIKGYSAGPYDLIEYAPGCFVSEIDRLNGLVKVDCTNQRGLGGFLYFSLTQNSCLKHYKYTFGVI